MLSFKDNFNSFNPHMTKKKYTAIKVINLVD